MATVEVRGFDKLLARISKIHDSLDPISKKGIMTVADKIKVATQINIVANDQVDTGSMFESVRVQNVKTEGHTHSVGVSVGGYVTNPKTGRKVDYAKHQEMGTSRIPARPFLRPAVEQHKHELPKAIKKGILDSR